MKLRDLFMIKKMEIQCLDLTFAWPCNLACGGHLLVIKLISQSSVMKSFDQDGAWVAF